MNKSRSDVQIAGAIYPSRGAVWAFSFGVGSVIDQEMIDCPTYQSGLLGQKCER